MRFHVRLLLCLIWLAIGVQGQFLAAAKKKYFALPSQQIGQAYRVSKIHEAAFKYPTDEKTVRDYIGELPTDGPYLVVEGDILLTEEELRSYLLNNSKSEKADSKSKVSLNLVDKAKDFYEQVGQRTLSYAIDKSTFPTEKLYEHLTEEMSGAAKDWQDICPECTVQFLHSQEYDSSQPSHEKVDFVIRYHDANGSYPVAAFFPHDPPERRYINVDPSYFKSSNNRRGMLRHAIGHVLGYRHSPSTGHPGCYREYNQWKSLTEIDPTSVMQYYCGNLGALEFKISDRDILAHRALFSTQVPPAPSADKEKLVISFEGGDIAENAGAVLSMLNQLGALKIGTHKVKKGENLATIYRRYLNIPTSVAIDKVAANINDKSQKALNDLQENDELKYPKLEFANYTYSRRFDSDSPELKNIREHWRHVKEKEVTEKSGLVRVYFRGYRLQVAFDSADELDKAIKALSDIQKANIRWYSPTADKAHDKLYFSIDDPRLYWESYSNQDVADGTQGKLSALVNLPDLPECAKQSTESGPKLFLIDQPIYLHPDIAPAIKMGGKEPTPKPELKEGKYAFKTTPFNEGLHHGTHLAGIIASQDDNVGLVGVHPGAQIFGLDWDSFQSRLSDLGQTIEEREDQDTYNIYVLASQWDYANWHREEDLLKHPLARKIKDLRLLWITAAGNTKTGGNEIQKLSQYGPRNLGELPSVIVVTACRDCNTPNAKLIDDADYSGKLVHIAAPGDSIPSTVADGKYATASGTSQATAFVAGVASAMVACHPNHQWKPQIVKMRLQVTSTPFLNSSDYEKVTSGILDEKMALLDPEKFWLKPNARDIEAVKPIKWCTNVINTLSAGTPLVQTSNVLRIINKDGQIWVYSKVVTDPASTVTHVGEVLRIGPLTVSAEELSRPLFSIQAERTFSLGEIEDLLLPAAVKFLSPCN